MVRLTPGMQQYMDIKNKHPDCIILFRMGDFYETFFEDAKTVARELEITLTSRGKDETKAPLAGIPYHAIEPYLAKLVKKGYKVGIVEQTEDPKKAKGLVKRDLVRIITPGTVVDAHILEQQHNNYIVALKPEAHTSGVSFCDLSTGEFMCTMIPNTKLLGELERLKPAEIIYPESETHSQELHTIHAHKYCTNTFPDRHFYHDAAKKTLHEHFEVLSLAGFGITEQPEIEAAGALLKYIKETQMNAVYHITKISKYKTSNYMFLDAATIRNLELVHNILHKSEHATLLFVIDKTQTPMGKRLMRRWVTAPLIEQDQIQERQDAVIELKEHIITRQEITESLKEVYDLERLIARVAYGNANPKDVVALGSSLAYIPKIKERLTNTKAPLIQHLAAFPDVTKAHTLIQEAIKDEPSVITREGNIIREGYNKELDELRDLTIDAKSYIAELEERERERTGIKSLKIKYNKVIGYYIDITKPNVSHIPEDYERKQSQVNSERFITEELKDLESKILGAQERIYELELELFTSVLEKLGAHTHDIQATARNIAELDCIIALAQVSQERGYTRPTFNTQGILRLIESRHPVIEAFSDVDFIANDCTLTHNDRTMIITGPNMAGKSTYLRQVAQIIILAQMGACVPAKEAHLPIIDRVFSRIGAYDDLVNHQSTFMVEMNETANIINNATKDSCVILDEIGRGTSTYDGVSLAWAIAEHLNNTTQCKTLFATHYHHLNTMSSRFSGIANYNIAVDEQDDKIVFLRKIVKGGTDKSYGIQVAKLAGLPKSIIDNATHIMQSIEQTSPLFNNTTQPSMRYENDTMQEPVEIVEPEFKTIEDYTITSEEKKHTQEQHEEEGNVTSSTPNTKIARLEAEMHEIKAMLQAMQSTRLKD